MAGVERDGTSVGFGAYLEWEGEPGRKETNDLLPIPYDLQTDS